MTYDTPLLLIVFNRPDKVRTLLNALEKVRPSNLYVAADGPRTQVPADTERCAVVREMFSSLPWSCTVTTLFQEQNLGCKRGVSTAINWFFTNVPEGIILEDDCIPTTEFFTLTSTLLEKYRDNPAVMQINGSTFINREVMTNPQDSYWFSNIALVWGWATWRRAWEHYDIEMKHLNDPSTKVAALERFKNPLTACYWLDLFVHIRDKHIDTWDAQWLYSLLRAKGLCITPAVNLIENIGFDADATHTTEHITHALTHQTLSSTLTHPATTAVDYGAEDALMKQAFLKTWRARLKYLIRSLLFSL